MRKVAVVSVLVTFLCVSSAHAQNAAARATPLELFTKVIDSIAASGPKVSIVRLPAALAVAMPPNRIAGV